MLTSPAEIEPLRQQHYNATLTDIDAIHDDLWILRIRPDEGVQSFIPGQYTTLGLGDWEPTNDPPNNEEVGETLKSKLVRRAYSFSYPIFGEDEKTLVAPDEIDYYEFYIALVDRNGEAGQDPSLTPRLFAMKPGDRLWAGAKVTGHYVLHDYRPDDQLIFGATGTGEAPHNCMISHLLREGFTGNIVSMVCTRYEADLAYKTKNEELQKRYPNFKYITLTTREKSTIDRKVYIQDLVSSGELEKLTGWELRSESTHVYMCGNPSMIGVPKYKGGNKTYPEPIGMVEMLEDRGFKADYRKEKGNVHFEEYW
jgi:ferredoxin/flavodoxin---NADP+ reductase